MKHNYMSHYNFHETLDTIRLKFLLSKISITKSVEFNSIARFHNKHSLIS